MSEAESEAIKAADQLDLGDGRDDHDDAETADESTEDGETTETTDEEQPDGLRRLLRTDKPLDLDASTDWWDPRGKGGVNRIGAAIKQMGGWQYVMPAVWLFVGFLEVLYLLVTEHGIVADGGESTDESDDQSESTVEGEDPTGGAPGGGR